VLILLNGALVPIDQFPPWLAPIAQALPSTLGILVLREVLIQKVSLPDVWNNGSLPLLMIHSTIYLIGGWIVWRWCTRVAKEKGILGQY
jgi:ABC-2 type transport system permease protein